MKMREPHTPSVWKRNFWAARMLAVGVEVVRDDQDGETVALLAVGTPYLTSTYWLALSAIWARRVPLAACQRIHSVRVSKRIWICRWRERMSAPTRIRSNSLSPVSFSHSSSVIGD